MQHPALGSTGGGDCDSGLWGGGGLSLNPMIFYGRDVKIQGAVGTADLQGLEGLLIFRVGRDCGVTRGTGDRVHGHAVVLLCCCSCNSRN